MTSISITSGSILTLPDEILTMIILNLHPREALFLSLTCRHLYYGVLSRHNSHLWYLLGGFSEGLLPGWSKEWQKVSNIALGPVDPKFTSKPRRGRRPKAESRKRKPGIITKPEVIKLAKTYPPAPIVNSSEPNITATTLPAITVDYHRLLREAMLGMTTKGCSWCLRNEDMDIIRLPAWNLKLCHHCIVNNALPTEVLTPDFPIPIPLTTIQTQVIPAEFNWFAEQEEAYPAIWKPRVQKLLDDYLHSGNTFTPAIAAMVDKFFNFEVIFSMEKGYRANGLGLPVPVPQHQHVPQRRCRCRSGRHGGRIETRRPIRTVSFRRLKAAKDGV